MSTLRTLREHLRWCSGARFHRVIRTVLGDGHLLRSEVEERSDRSRLVLDQRGRDDRFDGGANSPVRDSGVIDKA